MTENYWTRRNRREEGPRRHIKRDERTTMCGRDHKRALPVQDRLPDPQSPAWKNGKPWCDKCVRAVSSADLADRSAAAKAGKP